MSINFRLILAPLALCLGQGVAIAATVDLQDGETAFFEVPQHGTDLVVIIGDASGARRLDHPVGGNGPELFLLGPYEGHATVTVDIQAKYPGQQATAELQRLAYDPDPGITGALAALTEAGLLAGASRWEEAGTIYRALATQSLPPSLPDADFLTWLAAAAALQAGDPQGALAQLDGISSDCAVPGYCYKTTLLRLAALSESNGGAATENSSDTALVDTLRAHPGDVAEDLAYLLNLLAANRLSPTGDNDALAPLLDESLALARARNQPDLRGRVHENFASYHFFRNDVVSALEHLLSAADDFALTGNIRSRVAVMVNMHYSYRALGEYGDAQAILHEALPLAEAHPDRLLAREVYFSLGNVYQQMGDLERAEYYVRLALDSDLTLDRSAVPVNDARRILGIILRDKNAPGAAARTHELALEEATGTGFERLIALLQEQLALDYLALGELDAARDMFTRAYSDTGFGKDLAGQATSLTHQARLLMAEQRLPEAIDLLQGAAGSNTYREQTLANRVEIHQLLMQAYRQAGDFDRAVFHGGEAIAMTQTIRGQLEASRLGPAWSSRSNIVYKQLAELYLGSYYATANRNHLARAFAVVEQSRSWNLLQQRRATTGLPLTEDSGLETLRLTIAGISARRAALDRDDDDYNAVTLEYYRTLERYQARVLRDAGPPDAPEFSLPTLAARLAADDVLFEYLCVPDGDCHLITLSDGQLDAHRLGSIGEISLLVSAVNDELDNGPGDAGPGIDRLSDIILAPFLPPAKTALKAVLDYPLNRIPLAVLDSAENGPYVPLVDKFAISYLPSLQAYDPARQAARDYPVELAVLADPVFSSAAVPRQLTAVDSFRGWVDTLEPLPWSAIEARNLADLYRDRPVRVYTGADANRSNLFAEETRNARILHLASHAFFNAGMADLVGIAISSESPQRREGGDFITLSELQLARFNAELVVISGCETGQGEYLQGEGSMSLARGFLAQGANHVISTLWPVSDRASAEFMKLFYTALHDEGLPVNRALQAAQSGLRDNPRYRDPLYWAPYVLASVAN